MVESFLGVTSGRMTYFAKPMPATMQIPAPPRNLIKNLLLVLLGDLPAANPDHVEINKNQAIKMCVRTSSITHTN